MKAFANPNTNTSTPGCRIPWKRSCPTAYLHGCARWSIERPRDVWVSILPSTQCLRPGRLKERGQISSSFPFLDFGLLFSELTP
jgi:hypothetical protein